MKQKKKMVNMDNYYIFKYNQKEKEFNNLENSLEKILINENYNYLNSTMQLKLMKMIFM